MAVQLLRRDGGHILRLPQPGYAEAVVPAHGPQHLAVGVDPLVIDGGLDGADEILLFPLHPSRNKHPALQPGPEEHLPQQLGHRLQHPVVLQGKPVLQKAQVKAPGLDLTVFPHQGAQAGAVEAVQSPGNALQIRMGLRALDQHIGQKGVLRRLLPPQGAEKAAAQAGAFKPPGLHAPQADSGKQFYFLLHIRHPLFSFRRPPAGGGVAALYIILPKRKRGNQIFSRFLLKPAAAPAPFSSIAVLPGPAQASGKSRGLPQNGNPRL